MKRSFSNFATALKIISVVLVLSLTAALIIPFAGAADKYRVGVFTTDKVTYEDGVNANNYKYTKNGTAFSRSGSGTYQRIDYHEVGFNNYNDTAFEIQMKENTSLNIEAGVFLRDAVAQTGGFSSVPQGATVTWELEEHVPGYLLEVHPNGLSCTVKAIDSSKGELINNWIDTTIPDNIDWLDVKGTIKSLRLETIDINGLINLMTKLKELEGVDKKKMEDAIAALEYIKDLMKLKLKVTMTYGGKSDTTTVEIDILNATLPTIKTYIVGKDNINTNVTAGSTKTMQAKALPLRFKLDVKWTVRANTSGSSIDDNGKLTFKKAGTVTAVASPDMTNTFESIENIYAFMKKYAGKIQDKDWALNVIMIVLGFSGTEYEDTMKQAVKIFLKVVEVEMVSAIFKKIFVLIGNSLLKNMASETITFTVS